ACGSALGLVLGFVLASVAIRAFGVDLGSGYFRGTVPMLHADTLTLAAFFALGVAASVLGSLIPAIEAARGAPDAGRCRPRPRLPAAALARVPLPAAPAPRLALAQLAGAPGQLTVSLAAI